jgi:acyl-CoA dehydrogenase
VTLVGQTRLAGVEPITPLLGPSHIELAARVSDFAGTSLAPRVEASSDEAARREARELLTLMADAQLYEPIAAGDLRALCLTREIVAAASPLADAVLALQALGGVPLVLAGTDTQRARWLNAIGTGRAMAAFAMTEPDAGSDVAAIRTSARPDAGGWVLDGEKHLISNAGIADLYIVFAVTTAGAGSRGLTAFLVPADAPGLIFAGPQRLAAPHPLGRIRLDSCHVPSDAVLGDVNRGFKLGMVVLDRLRPSVGAAACGMAARALIEALEHATSRRQFGEPLASFQLVREKIGRMATELEAARLLVYRAAWRADTHSEDTRRTATGVGVPAREPLDGMQPPSHEGSASRRRSTGEVGGVPPFRQSTLEAAMAKSFATEAAQRIVDEAVQIAGGVGVLVGHPVERLYRAVRALRIYEGTTEIQRLIIGGELLADR